MVDDVHIHRQPLALGEQLCHEDRRDGRRRDLASRSLALPGTTHRQSLRVRRLRARVGIITVAATRCSPRRAVVVALFALERTGGTNEIAVSVTTVRTNR